MADEFYQVLISLIVLRKYYKMVSSIVAVFLHLVLHAVAGNVHLTAVYRLERLQSFLFPVFIDFSAIVGELLYAEHYAVVGDCHTFHAVLDGFVDEVCYLRLSVKNRIVCMTMQMNEIFHR